MSGTLFGLGLSQQHDANGQPMVGCLLYLYAANTSTPVTAYKDVGLTVGQEHAWPIIADANGRIPAFWLADSSYRARLTDANGIVQFDELSVLAIGSSGAVTVDNTVDPNALFTTGMPVWLPISGLKAGFVRMNGRTIGSATSGATERANADTSVLFAYAWNNYSDTICPVTTGRGVSAVADFAANKQIGVIDMRGRGPFGLSDMGNTDAATFTGATFTTGDGVTAASFGGLASVVIAQANLPNVALNISGITGTVPMAAQLANLQTGGAAINYQGTIGTTPVTFGGLTGAVSLGGSGTAHNNMPPFILGSWYWRL